VTVSTCVCNRVGKLLAHTRDLLLVILTVSVEEVQNDLKYVIPGIAHTLALTQAPATSGVEQCRMAQLSLSFLQEGGSGGWLSSIFLVLNNTNLAHLVCRDWHGPRSISSTTSLIVFLDRIGEGFCRIEAARAGSQEAE
jgi:hypothetical protein